MPKHRTASSSAPSRAGFLGGENQHGLGKRHDISRNLIRVWIPKYEAGERQQCRRGILQRGGSCGTGVAGVDPCVATDRNGNAASREAEHHPATCRMIEKLGRPKGRVRYAERKSLSKAMHGWLKEVLGFRRISERPNGSGMDRSAPNHRPIHRTGAIGQRMMSAEQDRFRRRSPSLAFHRRREPACTPLVVQNRSTATPIRIDHSMRLPPPRRR